MKDYFWPQITHMSTFDQSLQLDDQKIAVLYLADRSRGGVGGEMSPWKEKGQVPKDRTEMWADRITT